jgi:hypothetical protein
MYAPNRRAERKEHVLEEIDRHFLVKKKIDLSYNERDNLFLEGTGSMVLDRDNRFVFACLSPRTDEKVLDEFCKNMNYQAFVFHSVDEAGQPIYHTNVNDVHRRPVRGDLFRFNSRYLKKKIKSLQLFKRRAKKLLV